MKLNIIPLSYEDYDNILIGWWKDWGWEQSPARDFLPKNGEGGLIVYDNDIPVCAAFLYNTDSKVAWITWVVSNKEYKNKTMALEMLISKLEEVAKLQGNKYIFTNNNHSWLIKKFINLGYSKGTTSTELIKTLN